MRREKLEELKSLIEEVKIVKFRETYTKNKIITSKSYLCQTNKGDLIVKELILRNDRLSNAVSVLPITEEGNIILSVEPRIFTERAVNIGIPSGYIEESESPRRAAIRELEEKTGYSFRPEKLIEICKFYQEEGAYNKSYLAYGVEKECSQHLDYSEIIKLFECTYEEALELINLGYIEGCNSILTLERAKSDINRLRLLKN